MESSQSGLEPSIARITRPNYKTLRLGLKTHSSRFNHLHEDADLKKMSQAQALEIIYWFLEECFGIRNDDLVANFRYDFSQLTLLPFPDKSETFFRIMNANVLMMQGLSKLH